MVFSRVLVTRIYRPRFTAPYAQRSELKASVNNALLGGIYSPEYERFIAT